MGLGTNYFDESLSTDIPSHLPRLRFINPHQRGVDGQPRIHAQIDSRLERFDRIIAAVWIARIVRLTHASDYPFDSPLKCGYGRECQKNEIAPRNECGGQAVISGTERRVRRECALAHLAKNVQIENMVPPKPLLPAYVQPCKRRPNALAHVHLDGVTLAIVKPDGLNDIELGQRPS
jgi:hypothetical protein